MKVWLAGTSVRRQTLSRLRVAIVGAGLMGRWHARYAARCGAEIAAVIDMKPQCARHLQKKYTQARTYSTLHDCLEHCEVDVVHVCTHLDSHAQLAEEALRAGKHVLLEKPAARSYEEVKALVEAAERTNSRISCVHQFPFQRGFHVLRRKMNELGVLTRITFTAFTAGGQDRSNVARREVLLEILPHPLSLFRALFGDRIEHLQWDVTNFTNEEIDIAGELDDILLSIHISLRSRPTRNELIVCGRGGTAHLNLYHGYCSFELGVVSRASKILQPFRYGGSLLVAAGTNLARRILMWEPAYPGLKELIAAFYHSLRGGQPSPVEGVEMLQVALFMDRVKSQAGADPAFGPPGKSQSSR